MKIFRTLALISLIATSAQAETLDEALAKTRHRFELKSEKQAQRDSIKQKYKALREQLKAQEKLEREAIKASK